MAAHLLSWRPSRTQVTLFVASLAWFAVGIWWGLPDGVPGRDRPWGTDELGPVGAINEVYGVLLARQPVFNPQYPLFHYLVELAFVAPVYAVLFATGHVSMPAPMFPFGLDHPASELPLLTLAARLPSLLMAAGLVVLAFETGRTLRDRRAGLWAALFVALTYPVIFYARTTNVDMGALFWTAAGLLVFARCLTGETTAARLRWLALYAALAAGSKDANYAAFVPAGALAAWWHLKARRAAGAGWTAALGAPLQALALAIAAYLVTSGFVLRPMRFWQHLRYVTQGSGSSAFYFRHPPTLAGYRDFFAEFGQQMVDAMGWPLLVLAAAGAVGWLLRDRRRALWLLPALSILVLVMVPVRFVLPLAYVLAFAAADAAAAWWPRRGAGRVAARGALAAVVLYSAARGLDLTQQMLRDSRDDAAQWLATRTKRGDRVGYFGLSHEIPRVPDGVTAVRVKAAAITAGTDRPEFLVSIPLEDFEIDHEEDLPPELFARLRRGGGGYFEVAVVQAPRWFERRPSTFVNPPVRIFARADVAMLRAAQLAIAAEATRSAAPSSR